MNDNVFKELKIIAKKGRFNISHKDRDVFARKILRQPKFSYYASQYTLSEDFIEEFKDNIIWELVCQYSFLSEKLIVKYEKYIDWYAISRFQKLSLNLIEKYEKNINWYGLVNNPNLTQDIIRKYISKLEIKAIVINSKSSFDNEVNWYRYLSKDFINLLKTWM